MQGPDDDKERMFEPKINKKSEEIVRDRPVQDLLYDDALRRQEAQHNRIVKANNDERKKESKISNTNIEYLVHKFNREFEPVYE